jgi:hypothetical protein
MKEIFRKAATWIQRQSEWVDFSQKRYNARMAAEREFRNTNPVSEEKAKENLGLDNVNSPDHYNHNRLGIECIKAIEASMSADEFFGYLKGNILKYLWRYRYKNGKEDLQKAHWYLNELMNKYAAEKDCE